MELPELLGAALSVSERVPLTLQASLLGEEGLRRPLIPEGRGVLLTSLQCCLPSSSPLSSAVLMPPLEWSLSDSHRCMASY